MKFWKFEVPSESEIQNLLSSGSLPPSVIVPGLKNTFEQVAERLKSGDGVVLASLKGEEGRIVAFGKVTAVGSSPGDVSIRWAGKSHGVHPTGSGLEHWQTKTAFEISAEPAERYGLRGYIDFHLRDST